MPDPRTVLSCGPKHDRGSIPCGGCECAHIGRTCQQLKGGDPVSHCLMPRSSARVAWVLASAEVRAA
jgi:hypothetical protein